MRATIISSILSLSVIVAGQSLDGLPTCAQTVALNAATNSGCTSLTAECLCKNSGFIASLQSAILNSCSGTDQQTACTWGNSACSAYGVTIPCDGMSSSVAATSTPTDSTSSTMTDNSDEDNTATTSAGSTSTSMGTDTMNGVVSMTSALCSASMTGVMVMNRTTIHTSAMNSTMLSHTSAKPTSTSTSSGATSQYTGAASAAVDRRSGIIGILAGGMFGLALL